MPTSLANSGHFRQDAVSHSVVLLEASESRHSSEELVEEEGGTLLSYSLLSCPQIFEHHTKQDKFY